MLRILQINASYKPAFVYGGPTMSVSALCEMLSANPDCSIEVYTTTANGDKELPVTSGIRQVVDDVNVTYFKRWTKDHTHFSPTLFLHAFKTMKQFDIVHIHAWWNLVSMFCCAIALRNGKKVILSPRGTLSSYSFGNRNISIKSIIHKYFGLPLLKKCHFLVTSEKEQNDILSIVHPTSINIAHNLVYFPSLLPINNINTCGSLRLLFLSRVEQKKGLELLFIALSKVDFTFSLTIVGSGESFYVEALKKLSTDLNIHNNVTWAGGIYGDEKFKIIASYDLLILPSYDENFANVVVESLAVGTPVLLSNKVGLASYVKQKDLGWISEVSADSIHEKLIEINGNRERLKNISSSAPLMIQKDFDKAFLTQQYVNFYKSVVNKSN